MWAPAVVALAYSGLVVWAHQPFAPAGVAGSWLLAWPLGIAGALLGGGMVAWVASRFLVGVRRTGDLELLLTTPVGAESLVSDQWTALKRLFTRNVTLVQAGMFLPVLGAAASSPGFEWHAFHTLGALLSLAGTLLGTSALCWLALWFALKARSQAGAVVWAVGLAKGVPCLVSVAGWALWAVPALSRGFGPPRATTSCSPGCPSSPCWPSTPSLIQFARRRLADELAGTESRPALLRLDEAVPSRDMTFLPIIERELRVRARRRAGYWMRFGVALGGVLICLPQLLFSRPFGRRARSARAFSMASLPPPSC